MDIKRAQVPEDEQSNGSTPAAGKLLSTISTRFVQLLRENYGRGPIKAKTYVLDDIVVCVLRGSGFTALEKTIMDSGDPERIVAMRENFQTVMADRYKDMIEELTERKVLAFLSQAHVEPDITIEMFVLDRPVSGYGAVEVDEHGRAHPSPTAPALRELRLDAPD